eukprot:CAMPEP_0168587254 /NCGR_PEP_ID=MMETSP0420-20121227/4772_1 /TAXON_ID=498008 /ORGANISM="Pessonella sp." /LENGTH=337 /DNA_ID=CAMNT_0008622505 /DNA_START=11 /DNA_END=1024 /DNA_ORIENTATION=+
MLGSSLIPHWQDIFRASTDATKGTQPLAAIVKEAPVGNVPKPPPKNNRKAKHPAKAILSGGLAGGIEICITYPTEYVKTQLQLYEKSGKFKGPIDVLKQTVQQKGFFGLYRGLFSLVVTSVPKAAVRFGSFETFKSFLQKPDGTLGRRETLMCGLGAGVTEALLVVCPAETLKVKFIHDQNAAKPKYRGLIHGTATIVKEEGFAGIYKGITATILKQGSNQAIRFFTFGEINKIMRGDDPTKELSIPQTMLSGGIAGAASVFGNTPIDVIKTKMQGLESAQYKSFMDCVQKTFQREGIRGFYKGVTPRLSRVVADVAIVMALYSEITKLLDKVWHTD